MQGQNLQSIITWWSKYVHTKINLDLSIATKGSTEAENTNDSRILESLIISNMK